MSQALLPHELWCTIAALCAPEDAAPLRATCPALLAAWNDAAATVKLQNADDPVAIRRLLQRLRACRRLLIKGRRGLEDPDVLAAVPDTVASLELLDAESTSRLWSSTLMRRLTDLAILEERWSRYPTRLQLDPAAPSSATLRSVRLQASDLSGVERYLVDKCPCLHQLRLCCSLPGGMHLVPSDARLPASLVHLELVSCVCAYAGRLLEDCTALASVCLEAVYIPEPMLNGIPRPASLRRLALRDLDIKDTVADPSENVRSMAAVLSSPGRLEDLELVGVTRLVAWTNGRFLSHRLFESSQATLRRFVFARLGPNLLPQECDMFVRGCTGLEALDVESLEEGAACLEASAPTLRSITSMTCRAPMCRGGAPKKNMAFPQLRDLRAPAELLGCNLTPTAKK